MRLILGLLVWLGLALPVLPQELSALARLDPETSFLRADPVADGQTPTTSIAFTLSQPVPWRVRLLDNPLRLVLDTREVDWSPAERIPLATARITELRAGSLRPGWSRLVMVLDSPQRVRLAEMATEGEGAVIRLILAPTTPEEFADQAALPEPPDWTLPTPADLPLAVPRNSGPIVVVLDPGHGGIDPGAERDGQKEADLMLSFARELKELLLRDGRFQVILTREEDEFVPLETRISIARAAGADVFLSLHADSLAEGEAQGATIYSLSEEAVDAASEALAERHDRDDLLAGVDLSDQDDVVASLLMDMARTETEPRVTRLADALEAAITAAEIRMHRHPQQKAGFSVLKSPDIPSVLLELGFLSSARDLQRLTDPEWRAKMAGAILTALVAWSDQDRALRALRDKG